MEISGNFCSGDMCGTWLHTTNVIMNVMMAVNGKTGKDQNQISVTIRAILCELKNLKEQVHVLSNWKKAIELYTMWIIYLLFII